MAVNKMPVLFLVGILIGAYAIYPPDKNFGDVASGDALIHTKLSDYHKSDATISFREFYEMKWREFHEEKLDRDNPVNGYNQHTGPHNKYGLDEQMNVIHDPLFTKALYRLMVMAVHYLSFEQFDFETCFVITGFIILVLTYFYAFQFGQAILNKTFGVILAVLVTSNVYFCQLLRSFSEPQILLYPCLFFMVHHYFLKLHNQYNGHPIKDCLFLALAISLVLINGYANTTFILLPSVGIFAVLIYLPGLKTDSIYGKVSIQYLFIALIGGGILAFFVSVFWSLLLGESSLYHIGIATIRWKEIFSGSFQEGSFIQTFEWEALIAAISKFLSLLWNGSFFYVSPHESSILATYGFFNLIETCLFILGLSISIKYIIQRSALGLFLLVSLIVMSIRMLGDPVQVVIRYNFDYFFLAQIFAGLGLYSFTQLIEKKLSVILWAILGIVIILNMYRFNTGFIMKQNGNLGYYGGLYDLRRFVENEIAADKSSFMLLDWNWGDTFQIDLVTFFKSPIQYDVFSNINNRFGSVNAIRSSLSDGKYSAVYLITPGPVATIFTRPQALGGHKRFNYHLDRITSPQNIYHTIADRSGNPLFYIYKLTKDCGYSPLKADPSGLVHFTVPAGHYLDYIYFSGNIRKAELACGKNGIAVDFPGFSYDYFHFSFDTNSIIETYNLFDINHRPQTTDTNIDTHPIQGLVGYNRHTVQYPNASGTIDYRFQSNFPITRLLYHVQYILYHDRRRMNAISLSLSRDNGNAWETINTDRSIGTGQYGKWTWQDPVDLFRPMGINQVHIDSMSGIAKTAPSRHLDLRCKLSKRPRGYDFGVQLLTSRRSLPEHSPNFIIFTTDTSRYHNFARQCKGHLKIKLTKSHIHKANSLDSFADIAIGTRKAI